MLFSNTAITFFAIIPWLLITIIFILEILISLLQAYVFLILLCIYINDILNIH
jgi:F0F1-type ATP synthase membrane subunit a